MLKQITQEIKMKKRNPIIEWHTIDNKRYLKFVFEGKLTNKDAEFAAIKWCEIMDSMSSDKISLIWECTKMSGYEWMSRSIWQKTIQKYKNQILSIYLVTDSIIIQSGAKILSINTSFDIKCVSSIEQISTTHFES